jgi:Sec-independent protein secretion pathway component TatC
MVMLAVPLIIMYELSIVIARYVNPTTEVTAHNLDRTDDDEEEGFEPEPHEENGKERDL